MNSKSMRSMRQELEAICKTGSPVQAITHAFHAGVSPEGLSKLPAFKQLKNVASDKNVEATKRITGNIAQFMKSRPQM